MVKFGLGEIIGSLVNGKIIDLIGSKYTVFVDLSLIAVMGFFTLLFLYKAEFGVLSHMMCIMWGIQDGAINTHMSGMAGFEFSNN